MEEATRAYRKYRKKHRHSLAWVSLLTIVITTAIGLLWWKFVREPTGAGDLYVCTRCGMIRHTTQTYFPFTEIPADTDHAFKSSPLSEVLAAHGHSPCHHHQWVLCASGPFGTDWDGYSDRPGHELLAVVRNERAAQVLEGLLVCEERIVSTRWIRLLLDQKTGPCVVQAIEATHPSETIFETKQAFSQWWGAHGGQIEDHMRRCVGMQVP